MGQQVATLSLPHSLLGLGPPLLSSSPGTTEEAPAGTGSGPAWGEGNQELGIRVGTYSLLLMGGWGQWGEGHSSLSVSPEQRP